MPIRLRRNILHVLADAIAPTIRGPIGPEPETSVVHAPFYIPDKLFHYLLIMELTEMFLHRKTSVFSYPVAFFITSSYDSY